MRRSLAVAIAIVPACFLPEVDEAPAEDAAEMCLACAETECPAESTACFDDATCGTLVDCYLDCAESDAACQGACITNSGAGIELGTALLECTSAACPEVCPSM